MDHLVNLSDIPYPIPIDQSVRPFNREKVLPHPLPKQLSIKKCTDFIVIKYDCDDEKEDEAGKEIQEVDEGEDEGEEEDEDEEDEDCKKPIKIKKTKDYSKSFKDNNSDVIKTTGYSREQLENMSILEIRQKFQRKTAIYNYVLKIRRRLKNRTYSIKSRLSKKNK